MKKSIGVLLLIGSLVSVVKSQVDPLYLVRTSNQSLYYNPGKQAFRKVYVGIGLSNLNLGFGTGLFSYNDVFIQEGNCKYLNTDRLISNFKDGKKNYTRLDVQMELLGVGVSVGSFYVQAGMNLRSETYFHLPGEALAYLMEGNGTYIGKPVRSEFSASSSNYLEAGVLLQKTFKKKYTVGIRPKYLVGLANVQTRQAYMELYTDNEWNLHANGLVDAMLCMPDMDAFKSGAFQAATQLMGRNRGFGFDAGVDVELPLKFGLSASVLDIGSIHWNPESPSSFKHVTAGVNPESRFYEDGYLTFKGIDYDVINSIMNSEHPFEHLKDTLSQLVKHELKDEGEAYTTRLTPKLIVEARYSITENQRVSVVNRTDFYEGDAQTALSLGYSGHFCSFFDLSVLYTMVNTMGYNNTLGVGGNFKFGPVNWYLSLYNISMNFDGLYYQWKDMQRIAFQTGFSLSIGKRGVAKKKRQSNAAKEED